MLVYLARLVPELLRAAESGREDDPMVKLLQIFGFFGLAALFIFSGPGTCVSRAFGAPVEEPRTIKLKGSGLSQDDPDSWGITTIRMREGQPIPDTSFQDPTLPDEWLDYQTPPESFVTDTVFQDTTLPDTARNDAILPEPSHRDTSSTATQHEDEPSSTTTWVIQLASYLRLDQADALVKTLEDSDYDTFITQRTDGDRTYFRVRIGYFSSYEAAVAASEECSRRYNLPNVWIIKLTSENRGQTP